ncbi:hypothetical protein VTI28DRAFT_3351 [Corynascus sepedonium]
MNFTIVSQTGVLLHHMRLCFTSIFRLLPIRVPWTHHGYGFCNIERLQGPFLKKAESVVSESSRDSQQPPLRNGAAPIIRSKPYIALRNHLFSSLLSAGITSGGGLTTAPGAALA